jgi:ABC-type branched-subunit amino acid transport system ATPase component
MKIQIKNLGALKKAEFTMGDLTIICGGNNTGKTYATYALFGFLHTWPQKLTVEVADKSINDLLSDGVVHIDITPYLQQANEILKQGCQAYTQQLSEIFAANPENFKDSEFQILLESDKISLVASFEYKIQAAKTELFSLSKAENSMELIVSLLVDKDKAMLSTKMIKRIIADAVNKIIFERSFPNPFIASAERTGAAIFRKELNFARNRLLEEMSQANKNINPMELLFKVYKDYALPVELNVDFTRQLETIVKKNSFLVEQHPEVLAQFSNIIGGEYTVTGNDELYFKPKSKRMKLTMDESSSAVRSLLDIGFYLRHVAQPGDLLMIDEPELNLHPENQRRVARLFAHLVNLGIKIFITTHSDYIVKELNTLIMLNDDKPYLKKIAERENYQAEELLAANQIKVYIAEEALVELAGYKKRIRCQTFTEANVNQELGIEARSFDETINDMNRIQEAIVWGGDD